MAEPRPTTAPTAAARVDADLLAVYRGRGATPRERRLAGEVRRLRALAERSQRARFTALRVLVETWGDAHAGDRLRADAPPAVRQLVQALLGLEGPAHAG